MGKNRKIWIASIASGILVFSFFYFNCVRSVPDSSATQFSKEILSSNGTMLHAYLSPDDKWRLQTTEDELPKRLTDWIEWKEDKYFRYHPGFNPVAIVRGLVQNVRNGKRVSGASTITMQAVRLSNPNSRTWRSKLKELFLSIGWEIAFTKQEIFDYYISHLPFGGNVEGFRSASRIYFGKEPNQLSLAQCAALVVIPNQPNRFHPLRKTEELKKKRNRFLNKLKAAELITDAEWKSAILEPIFVSRHPLPNEAPHFSRMLSGLPITPIKSSIDLKLQRDLEQILTIHNNRLSRSGIANAALLLADYRTGEIKAWVGNPDFNDAVHCGEVDGVQAIRSPGSTLKPILYGIALQQGLITPKTILYDIPQEFGSYLPENFDHQYTGAVTVEQALLQSLNIPAIQLLREIGLDTFMHYTDLLGMRQLRMKTEKPGLSVAVGGCGTSLFELVQAYAAIADSGRYKPLTYRTPTENRSTKSGLKPSATEMIRHILSVSKRGEAIMPFARTPKKYEQIAWKTGTSFGRRDAWCVGFGSRYVLGVWFGNFNGEGNPALSGVDVAAPVFQQLISVAESKTETISRPTLEALGWRKRQVCTITGLLPATRCSATIQDWFLPLLSSQEVCAHNQLVIVNEAEKESYCVYCKPATGFKTILLDNPKPGYQYFLARKNQALKQAPPHYAGCSHHQTESGISIQSPTYGKVYFLSGKESIQIPVKMLASGQSYPVSVYANGKAIAVSAKGEDVTGLFKEGKYSLTVVDNSGKSAATQFFVRGF